MIVVCVQVRVKPEHRDAFVAASVENGKQTIREPGNLRFDVLRSRDDPDRFVLYEAWRDEAGMLAHKETAHYRRWRETVAEWMAEERRGVKYDALFPEDEAAWSAV